MKTRTYIGNVLIYDWRCDLRKFYRECSLFLSYVWFDAETNFSMRCDIRAKNEESVYSRCIGLFPTLNSP